MSAFDPLAAQLPVPELTPCLDASLRRDDALS